MNMQALLKQAQTMQKDIMKEKETIDNMTFSGSNGFVTVEVNGKKELTSVKIVNNDDVKDDLLILEDMMMLAVNTAIRDVDKETEKRLGKYSNNMPGLF